MGQFKDLANETSADGELDELLLLSCCCLLDRITGSNPGPDIKIDLENRPVFKEKRISVQYADIDHHVRVWEEIGRKEGSHLRF